MRIIFQECKKAFTSPILLTLLVVFSAFNIFLIISNTYFKDELKIVNELSQTYGLEITEESLRQFEQDIQTDLSQLTAITGEEFGNVYEFSDAFTIEDYDLYTEDEHLFFQQLRLKEMYLNQAKYIDNDYQALDLIGLGEVEIEKYGLSGKAADLLRGEYKILDKRFEQLKQNGETKEWSFLGKPYMMHSFLFRTMFKTFMFEALLLIVLATSLLTTYEFENKTHLLSYSTKRGRSLMKDKLGASLIIATAFTTFLLLITIGTYFIVFDYTYLWGSSISSALNWEYNMPYITWWEMPFGKFLLLVIGLMYTCMLLFSALTFVIAVIVKNSYFTFFLFTVFFAIGFMLSSFMPTSSSLVFISNFNLSIVVMNPHMLFTGNSGLTMFKYHELITIAVWTGITIAFCLLVTKYFRRVDIQ